MERAEHAEGFWMKAEILHVLFGTAVGKDILDDVVVDVKTIVN